MDHFYESIPGWTDAGLLRVYREAAASGARDFVEVGVWLGRSAAFLAVELANRGGPFTLRLVDHWRGSPNDQSHVDYVCAGHDVYAECRANLAPLGDRVTFCRGESAEVGGAVLRSGMRADFVFIDADHGEAAVLADLGAWWPVLRPGGVMAGHDKGWPGVDEACRKFFGALSLAVEDCGTCWRVRKPKEGA